VAAESQDPVIGCAVAVVQARAQPERGARSPDQLVFVDADAAEELEGCRRRELGGLDVDHVRQLEDRDTAVAAPQCIAERGGHGPADKVAAGDDNA